MNIVPKHGYNNHNLLSNTDTSNDPLEKIIDKYKSHPSITCINKHMKNSELTFTFQPVTLHTITKLIKLLNNKKTVQSTDIQSKLIKEFWNSFPSLYTKALITVYN